jgi:hypothetical protein
VDNCGLIISVVILNVLRMRGTYQNSYELYVGSRGAGGAISSGEAIEVQDVNHLSEMSKTDSVMLHKETGHVLKLSQKTLSCLGCDLDCNTCVPIYICSYQHFGETLFPHLSPKRL